MNHDRASFYEQTRGQLFALVIDLDDRLTRQQQTWAHEFLDANELGLALEMIADWLSEDLQPITRSERRAMLALVDEMSMDDSVARTLDLCPEKPGSGRKQ